MANVSVRMLGALGASGLLLAGCTDSGPAWERGASPTGTYSAEFPGEPEVMETPLPGIDQSMQMTVANVGDGFYGIAEVPLEPGTPVDLDGAVEGAKQAAVADLEEQLGEPVRAHELHREAGEFAGIETREVVAELRVDDVFGRFRGLVFLREDVLVQVIVLGADPGYDDQVVDRFFDSFGLE